MISLQWEMVDPDWAYEVENARVLLVGHLVYFSWSASTGTYGYIYHLDTKMWEDIESEVKGRDHQAGALVADKIYHYGGAISRSLSFCKDMIEVDLVCKTVEVVETTNEGPGERGGMSAVWAPWLGEIVFFGGVRKSNLRFQDVFAFRVDRKSWNEVRMKGQRPASRSGHSTLLVGVDMHIFGGYSSARQYLDDLHIADLSRRSQGSWSKPRIHGRIPVARTVATLNELKGMLILFGGYSPMEDVELDMQVYLPAKREWKSGKGAQVNMTGPMPTEASTHYALSVLNAVIYFTSSGVFKLSAES